MSHERDATGRSDAVATTRRACLAGAAGLGFTSVVGAAGSSAAQSTAPDDLAGETWELVWSDEFDDGMYDDTWSFAVGNGHDEGIPGWGNEELQYYTDGDNAWVEDGTLVLEAREEQASDEYGSYDYTSTRMLTQGKKQFRYGRLDVRATLPQGQGIWPAIWLLGSNIDEVDWPDCGEIDVMELVGDEPDVVHGTVHGPGYSAGQAIGGEFHLDDGTFADGPHTFSIVWEPDRLQWFVDGEQYFQVMRADVEARGAEWVFDDGPFYLLLNVAVGGQWPGYPDEATELPQQLRVEHVREYAPAAEPEPCEDAAGGSIEVDGQTVCDLDGDGTYRDVTGDGEVGQDDVVTFFEHQHRDAWKREEFDVSDNGEVNQFDVVALFDAILTN